jgi:hypothetical protein
MWHDRAMRRLGLIVALLLTASCSEAGQGNAADAGGPEAPKPRAPAPAAPCEPAYDYERCVDFRPAERMRDVWITGFERSEFIANAEGLPGQDDHRGADTWLTFANGAPDPALRRELDDMRTTAAVAMEFVGRRARRPGNYGHDGAPQLVIVDRILSARILGPIGRR